jgi:hypothetical protein
MNHLKTGFLLMLLFAAMMNKLSAQVINTISGIVFDAATKEPLPYATVFLKERSAGSMTDESGSFNLIVPQKISDDTLVVSSLGYKTYFTAFIYTGAPLLIGLQASVSELNEITVRPESPEYYIRRAMRNLPYIRSGAPYQTIGYYHEKILENKNVLRYDEGVFKSYNPPFRDTVRRQYQLLLYRNPQAIQQMQLMSKERKKSEEKENKKAVREHKETRTGIDFIFMSGGPQVMLRYVSINKRADDYLDSTQFKHFNYSFASSPGADPELMIIDFSSKGVVDHVKKSGRIYIHLTTNAILKIEGQGNFVVPALLRPLMFVYGFSTQDLSFSGVKEYQMIGGKWHFKNASVNVHLSLTKKHVFSANEHADYLGEQSFTVLKLWDKNISQIPAPKRYDPDKPMGPQVFNDTDMRWSEIDISK